MPFRAWVLPLSGRQVNMELSPQELKTYLLVLYFYWFFSNPEPLTNNSHWRDQCGNLNPRRLWLKLAFFQRRWGHRTHPAKDRWNPAVLKSCRTATATRAWPVSTDRLSPGTHDVCAPCSDTPSTGPRVEPKRVHSYNHEFTSVSLSVSMTWSTRLPTLAWAALQMATNNLHSLYHDQKKTRLKSPTPCILIVNMHTLLSY